MCLCAAAARSGERCKRWYTMEGGPSNGAAACSALPRYKNALVLPALQLRRTGSRKCSVLYAKELRAAGTEGNWAASRAGLASGCGCHAHGATAVARFASWAPCASDGARVDASASRNRSPCPVPGAGRAVARRRGAALSGLRLLLRLEEDAVWVVESHRAPRSGGREGSVAGMARSFALASSLCSISIS